jgi:hypothetical protein
MFSHADLFLVLRYSRDLFVHSHPRRSLKCYSERSFISPTSVFSMLATRTEEDNQDRRLSTGPERRAGAHCSASHTSLDAPSPLSASSLACGHTAYAPAQGHGGHNRNLPRKLCRSTLLVSLLRSVRPVSGAVQALALTALVATQARMPC